MSFYRWSKEIYLHEEKKLEKVENENGIMERNKGKNSNRTAELSMPS